MDNKKRSVQDYSCALLFINAHVSSDSSLTFLYQVPLPNIFNGPADISYKS